MASLGAHQHRTDPQNANVLGTDNGDFLINKITKSCHFPGKQAQMEMIIVRELSQFPKDKCAFPSFVVTILYICK